MMPIFTKSIPTITPKYLCHAHIDLFIPVNNIFVKPFPCEPFSDSLNCSLDAQITRSKVRMIGMEDLDVSLINLTTCVLR